MTKKKLDLEAESTAEVDCTIPVGEATELTEAQTAMVRRFVNGGCSRDELDAALAVK